LSEGDIVYLDFRTADPVLVGNKYTIFRAARLVRDPTQVGRLVGSTSSLEIFRLSINRVISSREKSSKLFGRFVTGHAPAVHEG